MNLSVPIISVIIGAAILLFGRKLFWLFVAALVGTLRFAIRRLTYPLGSRGWFVSNAIIVAGAMITQGLRSKPFRFSEIISAQSAAGGCSPMPKKLTEATRIIE